MIAGISGDSASYKNITLNINSQSSSGINCIFTRPINSLVGVQHTAKIEGITFDGAGLIGNNVIVSNLMDAYINNCRVTSALSFTDNTGGTRLTWGGET
jgi:hypothetical protein